MQNENFDSAIDRMTTVSAKPNNSPKESKKSVKSSSDGFKGAKNRARGHSFNNADNNGKNIRRQYIQPAGRFQVPPKSQDIFLSVVDRRIMKKTACPKPWRSWIIISKTTLCL